MGPTTACDTLQRRKISAARGEYVVFEVPMRRFVAVGERVKV